MLFNSYAFLLAFLPTVLALWWLLPWGPAARLGLLTAASYLFYGWWDWRFLGLLLGSTLVDYVAGGRLFASRDLAARRGWLALSLVVNLGVLGVFKYAGFAADSCNAVLEWLRSGGRLPVWEIVLPVGISFYTFQTMSYAIDLYRGAARPAPSLWHFAAYVSMFPQLVAGPIVRYADLDEQLRDVGRPFAWSQFAAGCWFFAIGMSQKMLLADPIAARIDPLLEVPEALAGYGAWYAMLGYSLQLYFDFAGYSNMAVGLGRMLGFEFCQNFDSPYQAISIADFWRRWHMSLSQFLRDYLFIPLGGSRAGAVLTMRNLALVMLLGGLWHGADWTFVVWGAYHGLLLVGHALWVRFSPLRLPWLAARLATFLAVMAGWVVFRAGSLAEAQRVAEALVGWHGWESSPLATIGGLRSLALLVALLAIAMALPNLWRLPQRLTPLTGAVAGVLLWVCLLRFDAASPFLYFQF